MKFSKPLIASAILLASSTIAFAATNSKTVQINVTEGPYVTLTGTAITAPTSDFLTTNLGTAQTIGTLGFDSNVTGNCVVEFVSANAYDLLHAGTSAKLVDYKITYDTTDIIDNTNNTVTKDCLTATPSALSWISTTPPPATIAAGTYTDTVTITVTTP